MLSSTEVSKMKRYDRARTAVVNPEFNFLDKQRTQFTTFRIFTHLPLHALPKRKINSNCEELNGGGSSELLLFQIGMEKHWTQN